MKTSRRSSFPFLSICKAGGHAPYTAHKAVHRGCQYQLELQACHTQESMLRSKYSVGDMEWTDPGRRLPERCQETLNDPFAAPVADTISSMLHQARQPPPCFPARTCLPSKTPSQPTRCQSRTRPVACTRYDISIPNTQSAMLGPGMLFCISHLTGDSALTTCTAGLRDYRRCGSGRSRNRTWGSGEASSQLVGWGGIRTQAEEVNRRACCAGLLQDGPATRPARTFLQKGSLKEQVFLRNGAHSTLETLAALFFCLPSTRWKSRQKASDTVPVSTGVPCELL